MALRMWHNLTTADFAALSPAEALVLLPLGATEQHGPHLPVGTDEMLGAALVQRVAERVSDLELLLLPSLWCTKSNEHLDFPGTLALSTETMLAVMHDLATSIRRSGLRRLVCLNWHGGNTDLLMTVARDIRHRHDLYLFVVDGQRLAHAVATEVADPGAKFDIHAGRGETSMMLAIHPELVAPGPHEQIGDAQHPGKLKNCFSASSSLVADDSAVYLGWDASDLSQDGVIGTPAGANAAEGERYLERLTEWLEMIMREVDAFDLPAS